MYYCKIVIRATGGLTFRIMPSSILDIATYPFVPPTAMSGWLRRLTMLAHGHELPEPGPDFKKPQAYILPRHIRCTGALPQGIHGIHRTKRRGTPNFNHVGFSMLYVDPAANKHNFQMHTWEYLFADHFVGYVTAEHAEELEVLTQCTGWGCKIGKEGYAYAEEVSAPRLLTRVEQRATPSTLVYTAAIGQDDFFVPCEHFGLYQFVHQAKKDDPAPDSAEASPMNQYQPWYVSRVSAPYNLALTYWHDPDTDGDDAVYIHADLIDSQGASV